MNFLVEFLKLILLLLIGVFFVGAGVVGYESGFIVLPNFGGQFELVVHTFGILYLLVLVILLYIGRLLDFFVVSFALVICVGLVGYGYHTDGTVFQTLGLLALLPFVALRAYANIKQKD